MREWHSQNQSRHRIRRGEKLNILFHSLLSGTIGYEVVVCASGREALATFQVAPERFALVITDHTMPHMTGIDLAHALRRLRPALPIILCTGSSDLITAEKARALGIEAFCMKPLLIRDLGRLVRQVLEQHPAQEA